jgi:hypothetical protein
MLLADRETASPGDPFSQELLNVQEQSITGNRPSFSSLEQNIPGFSLMFVLLTLIFSVSLDLGRKKCGARTGGHQSLRCRQRRCLAAS